MGEVVDLRGRRTADLQVKGSGLVKASQWMDYLDYWGGQLVQSEPWCVFACRATITLHQSFIIMARRLRKNAYWTGGGTMEEDTTGLEEDAERRLAWFEKHSEELDHRSMPRWALFLFAALQGAMRMQVRLAREAAQILRKGHLLVNVNPRADVLGAKAELGEEAE